MTATLLAANPLFGANSRGIIVFGFEIYYYALCIVTGIIVATALSALLMKRRNISPDFVFTLFIFCIPTAIVCARLFYCITDGMDVSEWFSWKSIRNGGLSIIGSAIGGIGMGFIVCKVKKISFLRAADCVVVTMLIAQSIGRWGNYFNGEVYGGVVENPALQWFPFAVDINGTWHYAFFFYESVINLIGFALLFSAAWFRTKKPNGILTFSYFVWYGVVRTVMEPLRDPHYILSGGGVRWSLVFSVLMIVGGLAGIAALLYLNYRKEGAIFGSKNGDPCGITEFLTPYREELPYFSKINLMGANYPPKPEEETFREKWNRFKQKLTGGETPAETQPENNQPEEAKTEEAQTAETQPAEAKTENVQTEESRTEEKK